MRNSSPFMFIVISTGWLDIVVTLKKLYPHCEWEREHFLILKTTLLIPYWSLRKFSQLFFPLALLLLVAVLFIIIFIEPFLCSFHYFRNFSFIHTKSCENWKFCGSLKIVSAKVNNTWKNLFRLGCYETLKVISMMLEILLIVLDPLKVVLG